MFGAEGLAHQGSAAYSSAAADVSQYYSLSRAELEAGQSSRQIASRKQRKQQRLCSRQFPGILLAAVLINCQAQALLLGGNLQYRVTEEQGILMRAAELVTEAVQDAANVVGPAAKRWAKQEKHTIQIKETQVNMHITKKPAHGGVPSWFTRTPSVSASKPQHALNQLEGNRRMLRRQKQHHHSVEDEWLKCHRRYVEELEGNEASSAAWDVLFYGDSIMEEWRGTFLGSAWGPFQDVKKVWAEYFGSKPYRSHALGIAGDKAEQLLWRLQNGELPASKHPKVVVVMIGTNDLVGNCTARSAQETAQSIMEINTLLHAELPATYILSLAVLPKGEVWPNRCSDAILTVNAELQEYASLNPEFAHFADIGSAFLSDEPVGGKYEVKEALMPDSLHPSAVGMRIVASQLEPIISSLVSAPLGADLDGAATA